MLLCRHNTLKTIRTDNVFQNFKWFLKGARKYQSYVQNIFFSALNPIMSHLLKTRLSNLTLWMHSEYFSCNCLYGFYFDPILKILTFTFGVGNIIYWALANRLRCDIILITILAWRRFALNTHKALAISLWHFAFHMQMDKDRTPRFPAFST